MHPVQADLLVAAGISLKVTHVNPESKVNSSKKLLLKYVASEEVIFRRDLHVNPTRGFVVVERCRHKSRNAAKFNRRTTRRGRSSYTVIRQQCRRINLICNRNI